jgi:hypothetical protein
MQIPIRIGKPIIRNAVNVFPMEFSEPGASKTIIDVTRITG